MGRNNHASFSFRGESNLQLLKRKIRKNGLKVSVRKGAKKKKNEEVCKDEESVRKRIWRRWLSFVRGPWSAQGVLGVDESSKSVAMASMRSVTTIESNATSVDVIEIPVEPGQKISKILIKPTRTGIKAVIAQCRTPSLCREAPQPGRRVQLESTSWDAKTLDHSDTKLIEECGRSRERSLNWRKHIFKNETERNRTNETLLTSALFIRNDMDKIVESAVFIEPNFPNDYADSRKSDELSQRWCRAVCTEQARDTVARVLSFGTSWGRKESIKINKRRVSYRIVDEKNDEIRKTFKTVSEPTWVDKKKIRERQHLQENINNLLEQFMFVESDDVVSLAIPPSRPMQDRKTIYFDGNSSLPTTDDNLVKEISREVSPEILVNIKPFKEYLSDDYLGMRTPSIHEDKKNKRVGSTNRSMIKSKTSHDRSERAEEFLYPVMNGVVISQEHDYANVLKNYSGFKDSVQTIPTSEREMSKKCYGDCNEIGELASLGRIQEEEEELSPGTCCTIWGVYKTYRACNKSWKDWRSDTSASVSLSRKESLDELLDTLDDSDHDIVFRKNISQFRKKISAVPHLDLKKAGARVMAARKKEAKKIKWCTNYVDFSRPIIESVAEESEEEEKEDETGHRGDRRMGVLSRWDGAKWGEEVKSNEVLETKWLVVSDGEAARKTLGYKVEEVTVNRASSLREIYSPMESGAFAVVQREKAARCEKLIEKHLICVEASVAPKSSEAQLVDLKSLKLIPNMFKIESDNDSSSREGDVSVQKEEGLGFLSSGSEYFYLIQSPWYPSNQQTAGCDPKHFSLLEKAGIICLEKPRGMGQPRFRIGSFMKCSEATLGPACRVVEILNDRAFEYVMSILGGECGCLGTCGLTEYSNSDSDSDFSGVNSGILVSRSRGLSSFDRRMSCQVDGFEILYNNDRECLNDDEDEEMKVEFMKNIGRRTQTVALGVEKEKEEVEERVKGKDGKEKEVEEGRERMREEKGEGVCSDGDVGTSSSGEKKVHRFLKYKSSSSPNENIIQNEFGPQEHRMRKSLILSKEIEKDFQNCRKKRPSGDKGMEVRRTGSALLESYSSKLGQDRSFIQKKPAFPREKTFGSLVLSDELKSKLDPDHNNLDKRKMLVTDNSRTNVRKEVVAAFNSIKEFSAGKGAIRGGNKRMSLVIMLSKK